jgi:hypothetical protein
MTITAAKSKTVKAATTATPRKRATKEAATPRKRPTKATVTPLRKTATKTTYATFDRTKDGDYRVTLRTSDNLSGASEVVRVSDVDAAHALLAKRNAVYIKNFRAAAALELQAESA